MTARWGVVATVRADVSRVKSFIAHHLTCGADWMMVFFDDPEMAFPELADGLDCVQAFVCDGNHYAPLGDRVEGNVRVRQTFNAAIAYAQAPVDWLAHIDVDEFLVGDVGAALAGSDAPYGVQVLPMEALESVGGGATLHCKLPTARKEDQKVLKAVYPLWGQFLHSGLLSHRVGKTIARTGVDGLRQRLHRMQLDGENLKDVPRLESVRLLHMHAPDWQTFWDHLQYRLSIGGYRAASDKGTHRIHEMLTMLVDEEGEAGVRAFYDELQLATPELIDRLKAHGLYASVDIDFDRLVRRVFED